MFETKKRIESLESSLAKAQRDLETKQKECKNHEFMARFTNNAVKEFYKAAKTGDARVYTRFEERFKKMPSYAAGLFSCKNNTLELKAATGPGGQKSIKQIERISDYRKNNFVVDVEEAPFLSDYCSNPAQTDVMFEKILSEMVVSYLVPPIASEFKLEGARTALFPLQKNRALKGIFMITGNGELDTVKPYMDVVASTLSYVLYQKE